jgi:hypothetical protein
MGGLTQEPGRERGARLDSPAHKVDDFEAVSGSQDRLGPACAGYDLSIVFDGYTISLKSERCNKMVEPCRLRQLRKSTRLTIENKC